MIIALTNHLWQSTLVAALAGLLTVAFRKNRAQVRYCLWLWASFKFLVPFSLMMSLGSHLNLAPVEQKITVRSAIPTVSSAMVQFTQPFNDSLAPLPFTPGIRDWATIAILGVWVCGFSGVALMRLRGWLHIQAAVCASIPIDIPATVTVRSSRGLLEPCVVGWLHPVMLLPADIRECLTTRQFEAVLAHELCHVRRRDNLTAAVHMIVEAVFWFYPLVWWISARLVEERERACDEAVLSLGSTPQDYAQGILNVCKRYVESPLVCRSGVTGSNLEKRIQMILTGKVGGKLNFTNRVALVVTGIAAVAVPVGVGMMNAPLVRAQFAPAAAPKFEMASITPCPEARGPALPLRGERTAGGKLKAGPARKDGPAPSPGTLNLKCVALGGDEFGLIHQAYVVHASDDLHRQLPLQVSGGPEWIHSDLYDINAKVNGDPSLEVMMGPMMQELLKDRFKLKIHRETREVPVYALTVATSRPKLEPFTDGSCTPFDFGRLPPPPAPGRKNCYAVVGVWGPTRYIIVGAKGKRLDEFSEMLGLALDRPVIDKTGIAGRFNLHLEFAIDQTTPRFLAALSRRSAGSPERPSIFNVVEEQLGLRLDMTTGPREFLVIDHVEKPSGD